MKNRSWVPWGRFRAIGGAPGTLRGRFGSAPGRSRDVLGRPQGPPRTCLRGSWLARGRSRDVREHPHGAFGCVFREVWAISDFSTISVRFFDENSIDFVERLLDDRRSLDDTFIVPARMFDVEKTLKNLDRAHKIRVRRRFVDPRSTRHELQTRSKNNRKIEGKFERKNDRKTT